MNACKDEASTTVWTACICIVYYLVLICNATKSIMSALIGAEACNFMQFAEAQNHRLSIMTNCPKGTNWIFSNNRAALKNFTNKAMLRQWFRILGSFLCWITKKNCRYSQLISTQYFSANYNIFRTQRSGEYTIP